MTDSTTVEFLVVFQPNDDEEFVRFEGEDREVTLSVREFAHLVETVGTAMGELFDDDDDGDGFRVDDELF